ncbi:MAG: PDZ domain-containing protein [Alphaproteobacteria bacterium]|nr:PDZ domain-containing protein [Alphaproteobacteria bacterium]
MRRLLTIAFLASLAGGTAVAQPVTSEQLGPPPGNGGYVQGGQGLPADSGNYRDDQTVTPSARPYRNPDNPYAAPEGGGAYNPDAARTGPSYYGSGTLYGRDTAPAAARATGDDDSVSSSCKPLLDQLSRYYGPPGDLMKPRDEACAHTRAPGETGPSAAFRKCSDDFFAQYKAQHDQYQACLARERENGERMVEQSETAVAATRGGYGGSAPPAGGPYASAATPGWIGVQIREVSPQTAYRSGGAQMNGAYVEGVVRGSPAEKGGLRVGDVIIGFQDRPITSPSDLQALAERLTAGQRVNVEVARDGRRVHLTLAIEPRP